MTIVALCGGHSLRPAIREPTDDRLAQLRLPPGFRIAKFAEKLGHPCMLTVGEDGTVYVTRRTPARCSRSRTRTATDMPRVFATGLRDTIGFGWHPASHEMWGMDHGTRHARRVSKDLTPS